MYISKQCITHNNTTRISYIRHVPSGRSTRWLGTCALGNVSWWWSSVVTEWLNCGTNLVRLSDSTTGWEVLISPLSPLSPAPVSCIHNPYRILHRTRSPVITGAGGKYHNCYLRVLDFIRSLIIIYYEFG